MNKSRPYVLGMRASLRTGIQSQYNHEHEYDYAMYEMSSLLDTLRHLNQLKEMYTKQNQISIASCQKKQQVEGIKQKASSKNTISNQYPEETYDAMHTQPRMACMYCVECM